MCVELKEAIVSFVLPFSQNNWVSQRSALGPRTLQQVHEEAKKEEQVEKKALHRMRNG